MAYNGVTFNALSFREVVDEVGEIRAVETGISLAAYLLLVGEDGHGGIFGLLAGEYSHERGISANAVVLSVGAHHAPVEA